MAARSLLALALLCVGCAHGAQRAAVGASDESGVFAAIQVQEARVAAALREHERSGRQCVSGCEATRTGCDASARLCELAQALADADAHDRCDQARSHCSQLRADSATCRCAAGAL